MEKGKAMEWGVMCANNYGVIFHGRGWGEVGYLEINVRLKHADATFVMNRID